MMDDGFTPLTSLTISTSDIDHSPDFGHLSDFGHSSDCRHSSDCERSSSVSKLSLPNNLLKQCHTQYLLVG